MVVHAAPLLERERELGELGRLLEGALRGEGAALVIEGPPGIGKSSLLAAARGAAGDGARVVSARGAELDREFPFGIVRQLLEPALIQAGGAEREALLAGAAALAQPVLSGPAGDAHGEPAFSALHGLYWLTVNLAGARPVVALVDDAQWADLPSLRWLAYLARRLDGVPLALLVACRPAEGGPGQALLDELLSIPGLALLRPAGLSEPAVREQAAGLLGREPDAEFALACHRATGGNPFLLRELLAELARRGIAPARENAGAVGDLSAEGIGRWVRTRLGRLEPACAALAHAVAVLGEPADPGTAAQLAGLGEAEAARAAEQLADAAVLEPRVPLAFVHQLVRASVYADLAPFDRAARHERAARLLARAGAPTGRIAVHLLSAQPRGDPETVEILRAAAADANGRGAAEVAVSYLRRALEEPPAAEVLPELAMQLGVAASRAGDLGEAAEQLLLAARRLSDPAGRARAADVLGSVLYLARRPQEAVDALSRVIDELPEDERDLGLRLQATRSIVATTTANVWHALRAAGERFSVGDEAGSPGERLQLAVAAYGATSSGTASQAVDLARRALAQGRLLDDPGPESTAFWFAPLALMRAGATADAVHVCDDASAWAKRHGSLLAFTIAGYLRGYARWLDGALSDAEAEAAGALEHAALPRLGIYGYATLINVELARGAPDRAEAVLRRSLAESDESRGALYYVQARARLHAAAGRREEALADLYECGRLERRWEIVTPGYSTWRTDAAPLLAAEGRGDEARRLAAEELERCRAYGAAAPIAGALRAQGGVARLEEAIGLLAGSPARLEHALALLALGTALRAAGREKAARERLRDALELARGCGAGGVAERAHTELIAAGARPRRDPLDDGPRLTAGELRVARLAAGGMSNREIAQTLFLTENTVQTHLKSVFRKLAISSRSQLARAL